MSAQCERPDRLPWALLRAPHIHANREAALIAGKEPTVADDTTNPNPTPDDQQPTPEPKPETPTFTQAQINAIIADERRKWESKAEADRKKAEDAAKEAALKEQGEYKALAEQHASRIAELEPLTGQVETLTQERDAALAVVTSLVEQELTAAPDFVRDAIAEKSPVDQLAYITKHRDKWAQGKPQGIGPTVIRNGTISRDEAMRNEIEAQRRSGRYGI